MAQLLDYQVLVQAILFFTSVACGLVISIPIGVTVVGFKEQCLLYTDVKWVNATSFHAEFGSTAPCNMVIYASVFVGIFFALGMGAYYIYALTRKDPNIGAQMWVLPFVLINSVVAVFFLVCACVISVGFKTFCDSYMKGKDMGASIKSCDDAERITWYWNDGSTYTVTTFYECIQASQEAAWTMFFVWTAQVGLGIVRVIRNNPSSSTTGRAPDMKNVELLNQLL